MDPAARTVAYLTRQQRSCGGGTKAMRWKRVIWVELFRHFGLGNRIPFGRIHPFRLRFIFRAMQAPAGCETWFRSNTVGCLFASDIGVVCWPSVPPSVVSVRPVARLLQRSRSGFNQRLFTVEPFSLHARQPPIKKALELRASGADKLGPGLHHSVVQSVVQVGPHLSTPTAISPAAQMAECQAVVAQAMCWTEAQATLPLLIETTSCCTDLEKLGRA